MPIEVRAAELNALLRKAEIPLLMYVWAPWCPPCKAMAADIEKAAHQLEDRAVVVKLNAVSDSQALTAFNVATVPSLILFSENGQEVARTLGYMTVNEICDWVDKNSHRPV